MKQRSLNLLEYFALLRVGLSTPQARVMDVESIFKVNYQEIPYSELSRLIRCRRPNSLPGRESGNSLMPPSQNRSNE